MRHTKNRSLKPGTVKRNYSICTSKHKDIHKVYPDQIKDNYNKISFFEKVLNALSNTSVIVIDESGTILFANTSFQCLLQQQSMGSNVVGSPLNTTFPFIDQQIMEDISIAFNDNEVFTSEKQCLIDGKTYVAEVNLTPFIYDYEENLLNISIKDITNFKRTDRRTIVFSAMVDQMSDYAYFKDTGNTNILANRPLLEAFGKEGIHADQEKAEGSFHGFIKELEFGYPELGILKLNKGQCVEKNINILQPDGRRKSLLVKKFPVYGPNNQIIGIGTICRDISDFCHSLSFPVKDESIYKLLVENQGDGVGILDTKNRFQFVNKMAGKIFEHSPDDLIDKSLLNFLNPSNKAKITKETKKRSQGLSGSFELKISLKNGLKKIVLVNATPYNEENSFMGSFVTFRDVTETRIAEKQLRHSEMQLKNLNAAKDKFFSIIAHDLKNPFGSIMGFSDLILTKTSEKDLEKIEYYANVIRNASANGYQLLENLLEWSRAQSGTLKYSPARVSLVDLIHNNLKICNEIAENKSIRLIPEIEKNYTLYIDVDMINTVLRNLITNAIKFTPKGNRVKVSAAKHNSNMVSIMVEDEGIGIASNDIKRLFKIQHSYSTKGTEGEEGTGLGLILCKEFVEKNKGSIFVESERDQGSTFSFTLPVAK